MTFHLMFVRIIIFSSVWVAESPPFGKELLTRLTICSFCIWTICFLVWVEALRPGQQFFSHVGTEPPLPGYYQYFLGDKCIFLKDTTRRPE